MIEVHSDGSSSGYKNCVLETVEGVPTYLGPGGWAYVLVRDGKIIGADSGGGPRETNNTMELMGAIRGLEAARGIWTRYEEIWTVADSQYVLGTVTGKYSPSKNLELTSRLRTLGKEMGVLARWVKGHQLTKDMMKDWTLVAKDVLLNFRCDQLAHDAKMKFK